VFGAKIRHFLRNAKKGTFCDKFLVLKIKNSKQKKEWSKIAPTGHNMKGYFKVFFYFHILNITKIG
jgi:hypothetical protein